MNANTPQNRIFKIAQESRNRKAGTAQGCAGSFLSVFFMEVTVWK